ncbi:acetone carboxylase subunit gamma [Arthrobacter castelli]|uniref:acetone carboxylase subunit gamma n=1 Tax=Arthrobacter castelli TaxID=271431 RepID=UPI00047ACC2C|nr:acetone carboxylase subunit gamma [Arthrobacter castelli]
MASYDKTEIADLIDGSMPWPSTRAIMSAHKDDDRFDKYLSILQERVPWHHPILLPIGEHLYIVQSGENRIVKCDCGHEFGSYQDNWKNQALIRVRGDRESIAEIYPGRYTCDPEWMELREFICPGCVTLLEVEAAPPGFPIVFDFLPDLEGFYEDWLGKSLPQEA